MRPLRLPAKTVQALRALVVAACEMRGLQHDAPRLLEQLDSALAASKPKRSVKAARARKAEHDAAEAAEWQAIRAKVLAHGRTTGGGQ